MGTLRDWWRRLTGADPMPPPVGGRPPAHRPASPPDEGLQVLDGPPEKAPRRPGAAGFDPYASDAGYAKPHSWERIDHD